MSERLIEFDWKHPRSGKHVKVIVQEVTRQRMAPIWVVARAPIEAIRHLGALCIQHLADRMRERFGLEPRNLQLYAAVSEDKFKQIHFKALGWSPTTEHSKANLKNGIYQQHGVSIEWGESGRSSPMSAKELEKRVDCTLSPRFTKQLSRPMPFERQDFPQMDRDTFKKEIERR